MKVVWDKAIGHDFSHCAYFILILFQKITVVVFVFKKLFTAHGPAQNVVGFFRKKRNVVVGHGLFIEILKTKVKGLRYIKKPIRSGKTL